MDSKEQIEKFKALPLPELQGLLQYANEMKMAYGYQENLNNSSDFDEKKKLELKKWQEKIDAITKVIKLKTDGK